MVEVIVRAILVASTAPKSSSRGIVVLANGATFVLDMIKVDCTWSSI
jgi:hypothetical protein